MPQQDYIEISHPCSFNTFCKLIRRIITLY